MRSGRDHVVLLPVVQVPGLAVAAHDCFLGAGANTLVIAAGTAAHNEDLLGAVELVDRGADEHVSHGIGDGILVDALVLQKCTAGDVGADVSVAVALAAH